VLQRSLFAPSPVKQSRLGSILATYDDYYTSLYFDRLNPQPQNENLMTHPLTDKIIDQIQMRHGGPRYGCYLDFRAAADWQLERDAEELKIILYRIKLLQPIAIDALVEEFKQTMRPQQQEDNQ